MDTPVSAEPLSTELLACPSPVEVDTIAKANAGAQLFFAIYYATADDVLKIPDSVMRAYFRAQDVFGPRYAGSRA